MKTFITFVSLLWTTFIVAQSPTYKMRLVDKGNRVLGVEMQISDGIEPTTADQIVDLRFGLRWLNSVNADLSSIVQGSPNSYNMIKSGVETQKMEGGTNYDYQTFSANALPFYFPSTWITGTWVEIMSVAVTGTTPSIAFEVCPTGFDPTSNRNFNVELVDYEPEIASNTLIDVVLPLELVRFDARVVNEQRLFIDWQTVHERNMARFEIEQSDNSKNWHPLSIIKPQNGEAQTYSYEDARPTEDINYYRLKMVNTNGSFQYSATKTVAFSQKQGLNISPNPLKAGTLIHIKTTTDALYHLTLIDATGRLILQSTFKSEIGLPTEGLANGIYLLRSESKGFIQTNKIIIQ